MTKNHIKTRSAPRTWNILRKANTFITRPNSGGQALEYTLPLDNVLRTIGVATTKKDVNFLLTTSEILVNGKRRHDRRHGVGLFDTVTVGDKHYMLTLDSQGMLAPVGITATEAKHKIARVSSVGVIKGGSIQLRLTDGRTAIVKKPVAIGTSVRVALPSGEIGESYALAQNVPTLLIAGKHRGAQGKVESFDEEFVTITTENGPISTKKEYAFVLGGNK